MRELGFHFDPTRELHVLCLGAHCDDIEIGCGGTILTMAHTLPNLNVQWVVFSSNSERAQEACLSAQAFLAEVANKSVTVHQFRDGFLPYLGAEVKEHFEQLKRATNPDVIFTHYRNDLHQDHRMVSELTWNTFRDHLILEYEVPKYDGDFGTPNLFVALEEEVRQQKIFYLMEFFRTQRQKSWFSPDLFSALLRLRGMEANSPTHYAEAFYVRKIGLSVGGENPRKLCQRKR
jgi:LmbE family N-acetylglucosaminyl deacetylase